MPINSIIILETIMATILWFYTPLQINNLRVSTSFHEREVFASHHIDTINVDCIESLAFVLTIREYSR